jgi:hypothetical protein
MKKFDWSSQLAVISYDPINLVKNKQEKPQDQKQTNFTWLFVYTMHFYEIIYLKTVPKICTIQWLWKVLVKV